MCGRSFTQPVNQRTQPSITNDHTLTVSPSQWLTSVHLYSRQRSTSGLLGGFRSEFRLFCTHTSKYISKVYIKALRCSQCLIYNSDLYGLSFNGRPMDRAGHYIFGLWFLLSSIFFFISSPNLSRRRLDVYHTSTQWCGPSANLECRYEMCCTQLTAHAGPKKSPKIHHLGTIAQFCRAISSQLRHESTVGKNLLNSNISPTRPHSMVNFGLLADEFVSLVWGTPANFNGSRVLAALLHGTLVLGVSETLRH